MHSTQNAQPHTQILFHYFLDLRPII